MQKTLRIAALVLFVAGVVVGTPRLAASRAERAVVMTLVGSTPCGDAVRKLVGGLALNAPCHAMTWDLRLLENPGLSSSWELSAKYNVPQPGNENAMMDGPVVSRSGSLDILTTPVPQGGKTYRLNSAAPRATLSVLQISDAVVHFLSPDGQLLPGTSGWSYSLSAVEHAEPPVPPSSAQGGSYTISPRATGDGVFALFEGRTPCTRITRELGLTPPAGCTKLKWRVSLFQDPRAKTPTTFKIEGSLDRGQPHGGTWRITQGTPTDPRAVVYELRAPDRRPMLLLKGSDDVYFMLDGRRTPLVGNRDFSYTLNRATADR